MKKYIFLAVSALTLASCSSDDFLGDTPGNNPSYAQTSISFGGTTGKISRATEKTDGAAAEALGSKFIVFGTKTKEDNTTQTVFDQYTVSYDATTKWTYDKTNGQSIKYWDYSASKYDFYAFSIADKNITVVKNEGEEYPSVTLKGDVSALQACFIAEPVSVKPAKYGEDVKFIFSSTGTKVLVGIYEQIPGYSIKNIKFHKADGTTVDNPVLYASSPCIPSTTGTGQLKITFSTPITKVMTGDNETGSIDSKDLVLPEITLKENKENKETNNETDKYLGRDRTNATSTAEFQVSPNDKITDGLTMKVDYTLISTDGSGETITVTGAEVKVPAKYTNWQSSYIYKYIFKITEATNGSTGGEGGTPGLKPIVFDAVVIENQTNSQITETEFKDGEDTTKDITNGEN